MTTKKNYTGWIAAIIIASIIAVSFLVSCKKIERTDFACNIYKVNQINGITIDSTAYPNKYLNMTDAEMTLIIKTETYTGYRCSNGIDYTIISYMQCGEIICH